MSAPQPPTSVAVTAGNRRATVTFTPPDDDGGLIITSYTVTAHDDTTPANGGQTASGQNPPIAVVGLTDGDDYYFTVTATNSAGTSDSSANSNMITVLPPREPDPPTAISAVGADGSATVSFTAPVDNGGTVVTAYEATAVDEINPANGGQTQSGTGSPLTVAGLSNGDGYTFQVVAINAQGTSALSAKSGLVIPEADAPDNTPPPPFPNAASFPLEKPVNLIQIEDEITTAVGQTAQVALVGDYDPDQPISPTNSAQLWVAPNTISTSEELQGAVRGLLIRSTLSAGTSL
jgi:hypothetical protein